MFGSRANEPDAPLFGDPRPHWVLYLSIAGAWLAFGLLFTLTPLAPPVWTRRFVLIGYVLIPLLGCIAAVQRARRRRGRQRLAWRLFAVGFFSWSLGGAVWLYYNLRFDRDPSFPSVADPALLTFSLCAAAALALLSSRWGPRLQAPDVLDILFIGLANGLLVFTFVFKPYLKVASADLLTDVTYLAFPTVDALALSTALFALLRAPRGRQPKVVLIASGLAMFALLNVTWLFLTAQGIYRTGSPLDLGWHAAFFLIIAGSIYPVREEAVREARGVHARQLVVPLLLSLFVFTVLLYDVFLGDGLGPVDTLLIGFLILILVVRQSVALAQNERLRVTVEETNRRLEEAAAFKTQFINATAHELANPLTPLKIHAKFLLDPNLADVPERREASAALIARNIDRLLRLVQDLLELARIESGKFSVRTARFDLTQQILETVQLHRTTAAERKVEILVEAPGSLELVSDPQRVVQVVSNLLSNAIKYSADGASLSIRVEPGRELARVHVVDRGPGMAPTQLDRLFRPFAQVQQPGVQQPGTGLGLYICKTLAERLGGTLEASSDGPGLGSRFTLTIPDLGSRPSATDVVP